MEKKKNEIAEQWKSKSPFISKRSKRLAHNFELKKSIHSKSSHESKKEKKEKMKNIFDVEYKKNYEYLLSKINDK